MACGARSVIRRPPTHELRCFGRSRCDLRLHGLREARPLQGRVAEYRECVNRGLDAGDGLCRAMIEEPGLQACLAGGRGRIERWEQDFFAHARGWT